MNKLLTTAVLVAAPLIGVSTAYAEIIGIGGAAGTVSFTRPGGPTNILNFSTAGFTSTGLATFQDPIGTVLATGNATYSAMTGTTGTISGGIFPITAGGTQTFTFTSTTNADALTGTVTWPGIKDGTSTPQFDVNALLTVTSISGTPPFTTDFHVGGSFSIDYTVDTPVALSSLTSPTNSTTGTFSSGEVLGVPTATGVPEPASLALLGSALAGFGWFARRRRRSV